MRGNSIRTSLSALSLFLPMIATASGLHPLRTVLPETEIRFMLRQVARDGELVAVECVYRPARERDVKKNGFLHLIDWPGRAGSRDLLSVHRDEAHIVSRTVRASADGVNLALPLRDPDPARRKYQLATVRIGPLEFERWFDTAPNLDRGYGLVCAGDALTGQIRRTGLDARPLDGVLPLWPTLRRVELTLVRVDVPVVQLWDSMSKHFWDGWRKAAPVDWPGGRTVVARHVDSPAVWRGHEYHGILPADAPTVEQPRPPEGVPAGVELEIFWPAGDVLTLPEAKFDRAPVVVPLRLSRLNPRARALLAHSVAARPGLELHTLSATEWAELDALAEDPESLPVDLAMEAGADGKDVFTLRRRSLAEPWLFLFGVAYDADTRVKIGALVLRPERWPGPLPE